VFGASEPAPSVLLNNTYGTVTLGHPLEAASTLNRLQAIAKLPLLNTADFETGVGMRIQGGTTFPEGDGLAFNRARRAAGMKPAITGLESRALGIHVDFAPVADVNNNARNPVINTRSFGESRRLVGRWHRPSRADCATPADRHAQALSQARRYRRRQPSRLP
jgi:beta-glucosidase-like glycosyl hydrolase